MNRQMLWRILCGCGASIGVMALAISSASAASLTGFTGKCGLLTAMPHPFAPAYMNNSTWTGTLGVDVLAVVDFDANTITFNVTQGTVGSVGTQATYADSAGSATFTLGTNNTGISSARTITFNPGGGSLDLNILPVNGGNTYLVQGEGTAFHGVCQAL